MAEDEEKKQEELNLTEETTTEETEEPTEQEPELTYTEIGENRVRWSNGVVADYNGNIIEEEEEKAEEPEKKPEPKSAVTTTGEPSPSTATQPQRQIYTRDGVREAVYTEKALQEIADKALEDPNEAERMRARLAETYQERLQLLNNYSHEQFEQELDELAKVAPKTVEKFARQIARRKQQLTPEQLQTPGVAKWVAAQVTAEAFVADPLTMEEAVLRSVQGGAGTLPKPAAKVAEKPKPIPREERLPGPGAGRRQEPSRPRRSPTSEAEAQAQFYAKMHGVSLEEGRQYAEEVAKLESDRRRTV